MAAFKELFFAYMIGGFTFMPLLIAIILAYSYLHLPHSEIYVNSLADATNEISTVDGEPLDDVAKLKSRSGEPEIAAGYFAVCREYVVHGINGKPPERTTPAGETIAAESPSVYQNMYRTIFDRSKSQGPSFETGKPVKKARNVFYVVLRHGHLLLFDNIEQLEVRHVIALAAHQIDIYGGGEPLTDGELFIKRNCIRLSRRQRIDEDRTASLPFFLFSDNCSEKEDFYHSLLHAQEKMVENQDRPSSSLMFGTEDMIKLVRQLHATEETVQTRWLNAMIGRLFLALYKTPELQEAFRLKISKKMARLSKSAFLTSLNLDSIDIGHSAPIISNPKLREMTVDGALTIETDVKYTGEFKIVIAALARLDLGSRFRPREVNLVLAGIIKKLSGHLLLRIKPPPSNRIWITFETMPRMDMIIEPVVSSRQITYGLIIRAIESRIKEVMCETIVLPNWDDIPFTSTVGNRFRGGIWEHPKVPLSAPNATRSSKGSTHNKEFNHRNVSSPHILIASQIHDIEETDTGVLSEANDAGDIMDRPDSFQITVNDNVLEKSSSPLSEWKSPPRAMRSNSFAAVARPVVTTGLATGDAAYQTTPKSRKIAQRTMRVLSERSIEPAVVAPQNDLMEASQVENSQLETSQIQPVFEMDIPSLYGNESNPQSHETPNVMLSSSVPQSTASLDTESSALLYQPGSPPHSTPKALAEVGSSPSPTSKDMPYEKKSILNQSISSATFAAKKWGLGVLSRQGEGSGVQSMKSIRNNTEVVTQPIGRGKPLPPPGMPLPGPEKRGLAASTFQSLRRKPVPGLAISSPARNVEDASAPTNSTLGSIGHGIEKDKRWTE